MKVLFKQLLSFLTIFTATLTLTGCSFLNFWSDEEDTVGDGEVVEEGELLKPVQQHVDPVAPMVLRVVGYGAVNEKSKRLSAAQKRLMAIRTSRLDAYRAMAERVYGTAIRGSSTVRDMVAQNDAFRTYVDAFIHGARVVSSDIMSDGSVETILEMVIDQGFRNCLTTENNMRFNSDCRNSGVVHDLNAWQRNQNSRIHSQSAVPESNYYFME